MKKPVCLAVAFLLVLCGSYAWAAPKLETEETAYDFGEILKGDQAHHIFKIRNGGDQPLTIEKVKTSCGCTAALLSEKILAPGQTAELKTNFDSTRFKGAIKKTIYISSNDPQQPEAKLFLTGHVRPQIQVDPDPLRLDSLAPETTAEATVNLTNYGKTKVRLLKVTVTSKDIAAEIPVKVVLPGETVPVRIRATPGKEAHRVGGYVSILTDGIEPRINIQVYGLVSAQ